MATPTSSFGYLPEYTGNQIQSLQNYDNSVAPTDGQVLAYNESENKWGPISVSGGVGDPFAVLGVPSSATDLGTFTGTIISDNTTVKDALQEIETPLETVQTTVTGLTSDVAGLTSDVAGLTSDVAGLQSDVTGLQGDVSTLQGDVSTLQSEVGSGSLETTALRTLSGTAVGATDNGVFVGTTIPDNVSTKVALQALETAVEASVPTGEVTSLRTLSGTAAGDNDMGTFTGSIIPDASTTKAAIQSLETPLETAQGDIGTLQTDVTGLQTDVGALQTDVGALQTDVGTLQTDVGTLQTDVGALQTGLTTAQGDISTLQGQVSSGDAETTALRTTVGTAAGATNMGTFTGSTITDNSSIKTALQELETAVESVPSAPEVTSLRTLSGTAAGDNDMGTFTGSIIPDASTTKAALQSLETPLETAQGDITTLQTDVGTLQTDVGTLQTDVGTLQTDVGALQTGLTTAQGDISTLQTGLADNDTETAALRTTVGTAAGATDLGTFTGSIITDNSTVKTALQELETSVEAVDTSDIAPLRTLSGTATGAVDLGTFTGSIITDNSTVKTAFQELETTMDTFSSTAGRTLSSVSMTGGVDLSNTEIFLLQTVPPATPDIVDVLGIGNRVLYDFENCLQVRFQMYLVGLDLTLIQTTDEFVLQFLDVSGTDVHGAPTGTWTDVATAGQSQITVLGVNALIGSNRDVVVLSDWFNLSAVPAIYAGSSTPGSWPKTPEALLRMITRRSQGGVSVLSVTVDIGRVSMETR